MEMFQSTAVGMRGPEPIKGSNSSEKVSRERLHDDTSVRVNEGLDPVTCRAFSRSMMQCVGGLQPLCYRSTAQHNSTSSQKRQLLMDSLTDKSIDRFGQPISWHGDLLNLWFDEGYFIWNLFLWSEPLQDRKQWAIFLWINISFSPLTLWNANNSITERRLLFIKKSSHRQAHTLRALFLPSFSLCPSWNLPPETPTSSPLLNIFFFFLRGGTLRKNVIQHIQLSAPKSLLQTCSHWFSQRINCSK